MAVERMGQERRIEVRNFIDRTYTDELATDVRKGLGAGQKHLPSKYFYDERGSRLFEEICTLPNYYPTRIEMSILNESARDIMAPMDGGDMVELGAGADMKARILIGAAVGRDCKSGDEPACEGADVRYVPVDVSEAAIRGSALSLVSTYPSLRVVCMVADFTRDLNGVVSTLKGSRQRLFLFLGSTIGNLTEEESVLFLRDIADAMAPADRLLLGIDMVKPRGVLEAAYNDSRGLTSEFNKNILRVVNRGLGADFDTSDFDHHAFFNEPASQIEMHLVAKRDVEVEIPGLEMTVPVVAGETIHTEISRKFTRESATRIFERSGLVAERWHTDPKGWFSVVELRLSE